MLPGIMDLSVLNIMHSLVVRGVSYLRSRGWCEGNSTDSLTVTRIIAFVLRSYPRIAGLVDQLR
jgi:hypothetical protein